MIDEELVAYFKAKPYFQRFMAAWVNKIKVLGYVGGTVVLNDPTKEEIESLGAFLGKNLHGKNPIRITYQQFYKSVQASRFQDADLKHVFELYVGCELIANKKIASQQEIHDLQLYEELKSQFVNSHVAEWLSYLQKNRSQVYHRIIKIMNGKKKEQIQLTLTLQAINELPMWSEVNQQMAVFASQVCKDPHFFDEGVALYLLVQSICYFKHVEEDPKSIIQKKRLLYEAGLLQDECSNFTMIAHLNAYTKNKELHVGWSGFFNNYEPMNIHLGNLKQIDTIVNDVEKVLIFENPSVFGELVTFGKQGNIQNLGYVCTNGQLNLSSYLLIEKISEAKIAMAYCGDFDPEGLLIADKVLSIDPNIELLCYEKEDYKCAISHKMASESRLKMLDLLENERLMEMANLLRKYKYCGYQENLIECYIKSLKILRNREIIITERTS